MKTKHSHSSNRIFLLQIKLTIFKRKDALSEIQQWQLE